jgi:hypothetical protein
MVAVGWEINFKKRLIYQRVISLQAQVGVASQKNKALTQTIGHARGEIRCLGGVSIPCRQVISSVRPISNAKIIS